MEGLNELSLSDEEEALVGGGQEEELPIDIQNNGLSLVGRFLADKKLNVAAIKTRLAVLWRPKEGVAFSEIADNTFIFEFYHVVDRDRIVEGGPWSFDNCMLVWHEWPIGVRPDAVKLNLCPIWVQVYDVPPGSMSEKIGKEIGRFLGGFMEYDKNNNSSYRRQYMRLRVTIDVRKPLKRYKKILYGENKFTYLNFKYERLGNFCYICGLLGHTEKFCEKRFRVPAAEIVTEWGAWLKAPIQRTGEYTAARFLREVGGKPSLLLGGARRLSIEQETPNNESDNVEDMDEETSLEAGEEERKRRRQAENRAVGNQNLKSASSNLKDNANFSELNTVKSVDQTRRAL